jgi:hypothetical protein
MSLAFNQFLSGSESGFHVSFQASTSNLNHPPHSSGRGRDGGPMDFGSPDNSEEVSNFLEVQIAVILTMGYFLGV